MAFRIYPSTVSDTDQAPAAFALFGEAPGENEIEHLHIEDIRARARLYDWTITSHAHIGIWQFIYVDKGGADALIEGDHVRLDDRNVLAVPDGVVHGFDFEIDTDGWVLSVETRLLEAPAFAQTRNLLVRNSFRATRLSLSATQNWEVRTLFQRLHAEFRMAREARSAMLESLAAVLLILLLREAPNDSDDNAGLSRSAQLLSAFRNLVGQKFREHWPVTAYADALAVSQSQLARICRSLTGLSPIALINARLLLEAQRNLRYSAASVAQIAMDLGFQDPAYFSRFFKRMTGVTPLAYKRRGVRQARQTAESAA